MKSWAPVLIALVVSFALLAASSNAAPSGGDQACQLKAKEAKDCSLCCATGGFNKFDSAKFAAGKGCACYTDEKELATNARHKPRRP